MKISTRARYGTRLMLELGLNYGQGQVLLKQIAESQDISEKYLSQIIMPLKAAGLVRSFRGAHGGYILSRSPKDITLKEIVEVLEGSLEIAECVEDPTQCKRISVCVTQNLWATIGEKIKNTLEDVTLADLVKKCLEKEVEAVMYNI